MFAENPKALPKWLEANVENFEGKVVAEPAREDIDVPVNEDSNRRVIQQIIIIDLKSTFTIGSVALIRLPF